MTASLRAIGCGRSAGKYYTDDPSRSPQPNARDDYYVDEAKGVWWTNATGIVVTDTAVDKQGFHNLCGGLHPLSGVPLVRGAGEGHRAGWDLTFSCPKSFSILWAAGSEAQRAELEEILDAAVNEALRFVLDEQLVSVRRGAGGKNKEPATQLVAAKFAHMTSREGDPACHMHVVLLNIGRTNEISQAQGTRRKCLTLEPKRLFQFQVAVGGAFRLALANRLINLDLKLRKAGVNQFEIVGIPQRVIEEFSTRSRQIRDHAGADASAAQKEIAALATRRRKDNVPTGDQLESRWRTQFFAMSIDPWRTVREAVPVAHATSQERNEFESAAVVGSSSVAVAASKLLRTNSVVARKDLLSQSFAEAVWQAVSIQSVYEEMRALTDSQQLLVLNHPSVDTKWSTPAIVAEEAALVRTISARRAGAWFKAHAVDAILEQSQHLSEQQREALQLACSNAPTTLFEAGAGVGKTLLVSSIIAAAGRSGVECVLGLAPSWVAADELRNSTGIETMTIAKFRQEITDGRRSYPTANALIVVDEAGMVSRSDMAFLVDACSKANAGDGPNPHPKLLLCGDRRQLSSPQGGSALRLIDDLVERTKALTEVRRQTLAWQKAASTVMAQGDSEAGLREYAKQGRIALVRGEEAAREAAVREWLDLRRLYGSDVLVVTRRNKDAAQLNTAIREILRSEGELVGRDVAFRAVDRGNAEVTLHLAVGDTIRFGETLVHHGIRNGTRGLVSSLRSELNGESSISVTLDSGRVVTDKWSGFTRKFEGSVPKIVHGIAGTAYSVQGRTAEAAVFFISSATDARETYVALTRHRKDARIVVESTRFENVDLSKQASDSSETSVSKLECLFAESRRYHEKENVIDYAADRLDFVQTGIFKSINQDRESNIGYARRAALRIADAVRALVVGGIGLLQYVRSAVPQKIIARDQGGDIEPLPNSLDRKRDRFPEYGR